MDFEICTVCANRFSIQEKNRAYIAAMLQVQVATGLPLVDTTEVETTEVEVETTEGELTR